jgi:hypothetical protein
MADNQIVNYESRPLAYDRREIMVRSRGAFLASLLGVASIAGSIVSYVIIRDGFFAMIVSALLFFLSLLFGLIALIGALLAIRRKPLDGDVLPHTLSLIVIITLCILALFTLPVRFSNPFAGMH